MLFPLPGAPALLLFLPAPSARYPPPISALLSLLKGPFSDLSGPGGCFPGGTSTPHGLILFLFLFSTRLSAHLLLFIMKCTAYGIE